MLLMHPDYEPNVSVTVFDIIHPVFGKQYVARVFIHGGIITELVFDTVPTETEIQNILKVQIDGDIRYAI